MPVPAASAEVSLFDRRDICARGRRGFRGHGVSTSDLDCEICLTVSRTATCIETSECRVCLCALKSGRILWHCDNLRRIVDARQP